MLVMVLDKAIQKTFFILHIICNLLSRKTIIIGSQYCTTGNGLALLKTALLNIEYLFEIDHYLK